jgi:hypothetical protein
MELFPYSHGSDQWFSKTFHKCSWNLTVFFIFFSVESRQALGPTHPPIQWSLAPPSLGVKRPGRWADCSLTYSTEVKNSVAIPPLPHTSSWCGAKLLKHRGDFIFILPCYCFSGLTIWDILVLMWLIDYIAIQKQHPESITWLIPAYISPKTDIKDTQLRTLIGFTV